MEKRQSLIGLQNGHNLSNCVHILRKVFLLLCGGLFIGVLLFPSAIADRSDESWLRITPAVTGSSEAGWTFMVYMAADNNLDVFTSILGTWNIASDNINEMETVGSTDEVNIVVLLDRWDDVSGAGSWIYRITYDDDLDEINSEIVAPLDEVNTGDPETLENFVEYSATYFPADKYALVLWGHGAGWFGVCWDWTNGDFLMMNEVQVALSNGIEAGLLEKIDLVGFDACTMSVIDVAYEIRGLADVMVASEGLETSLMWPYDMLLAGLVEYPQWSAEDLALEIVDDYVASFSARQIKLYDPPVTIAAINLAEISTLADLIDPLSCLLMNHLPEYEGAITGARNSADRYWNGDGPFIDLYNFISRLGTTSKDSDLKSLADQIASTRENVIIMARSHNMKSIHKHAVGLSIFFPLNRAKLHYGFAPEDYLVANLDFVNDTHWDELVAAYFGLLP